MELSIANATKGHSSSTEVFCYLLIQICLLPPLSKVYLLFHLIAYLRLIACCGLLINSFKVFNCIVSKEHYVACVIFSNEVKT